MAGEPCGLVAQAGHALDLSGADAFLGAAHLGNDEQPDLHGDFGVLEDRVDADGKLLSTVTALPKAGTDLFLGVGFDLVSLLQSAAVRADRAIGPHQRLDELYGLVFIGEKRG